MILSKRINFSGLTLIECTVATTISVMFLSSLFVMNSASMQSLRLARETACASQVLQQRIESMRIANWHQITDANWIRNNLLNTLAAGTDQLKEVTETLTLIPYGSSATETTQLIRTGGNARVVTANTTLLKENAMKIIWVVDYTGIPNNHPKSRQTVAILAKGGMAKW